MEKNHLAAYANLRKSLTINPNDSWAWNNFSLLLKRKNQWEKATYAYEQAILLKNDNNSAWENLAVLLPKVVDTERAEEIQRKLQKQRRSNPNFYTRKGNRYLFDGEIDDAEKAFKKSSELENDNHYAWFGLAKVNSMRGDRVTSIRNLKKA